MYMFNRNAQTTFSDFNQPLGMKMNANNRWVKKADMIPQDKIEEKYSKLFPSKTGMPAKPLRMALGSLLIQKQYGYSDEELVEQLRENPYYQYFIGMSGYEDKYPFVPSFLVEFRKRLSEEILCEVNEIIIASAMPENDDSDDYVRRDLKYVDEFLALDDVKLTDKQAELLDVIRKVYEQQRFMFENKTHSVADRIVSISQPYIRPIVRGKAKSPVEFGTKLGKY